MSENQEKPNKKTAARVRIRGIVQGVGFRPFLHRLANRYGVCGYVRNTSAGVELWLEAEPDAQNAFLNDLAPNAPEMAVIESVEVEKNLPLRGLQGFAILESSAEEETNTLVLPDLAICPACRKELLDPVDRRYRYPFINCTDCGPRFTIVERLPYDRASTTMKRFPMCPTCSREYHSLAGRRYHAQPDCCGSCGPQLILTDAEGEPMEGDAVQGAAECLLSGGILAVKGLGGFHLACAASDREAVRKLRLKKHRDERPFAVMCSDIAMAKELCRISEEEARILSGPRAPIVLLKKKDPAAFAEVSFTKELGIMLPYTPLHLLLLQAVGQPLVMTSGNLSDRPVIYRNEDALRQLRSAADCFLLHDRDIYSFCDDSLCRVLDGSEYFIRRSRGYVPQPILTAEDCGQILACGAEQKASFSLSKGFHLMQSQHIGDLKNFDTLERYEEQVERFCRLFEIRPQTVVCDLHPDYLSTDFARRYAEKTGIPLIQVQHHHAHMAACMLDRDLKGPVIGLIWDGTGLGTDGTVWGAECLIGGCARAERFGTILPIPLIGGDRAVKEISRVGFALLRAAGCEEEAAGMPDAPLLEQLLRSGVNCAASSGMGRLFDGAAAILGLRKTVSYEGQGAVLLEETATESSRCYPILMSGSPLTFDWRPMIRGMAEDKNKGKEVGEIAAAFMNTLVEMAAQMCRAASDVSGLKEIVLSGGSFQNMYLMERLPARLERSGFIVYHHKRLSANDEGISAGQLAVAVARMREGLID